MPPSSSDRTRWCTTSGSSRSNRPGVAISDKPEGPFRYLGGFRPNAGVWPVNVTAADILNARHSPQFEELMRFQVKRAQQAYDDAFALLPAADRRAQRPGLMMAAIYRTLLDEIERDGFHVLTQRISLTPIRKLWLAWKTYIRG